jgi:hypothetical protein
MVRCAASPSTCGRSYATGEIVPSPPVEERPAWLGVFEERHAAIGAVMVVATQPLPQVVAAVLAAASAVP